MLKLKDVVPQLVVQLSASLAQRGRAALVTPLESASVSRCTFSDDPDVGYIYLFREQVSPLFANLAAPVAETISFWDEYGLNVDIDHEGQLFGIEYVGREDLQKTLKAASAL
jgi:hypothetical protein